MKGSIGYNLRISGVERYIKDIYLMFLFRKIDITLCQMYTKIHIYAILYKRCNMKQIIFQKYETNLKKDDIPQKPENLRFAPVIII